MKYFLLSLSTFFVLLSFGGCGKKAEVKNRVKSEKSLPPTLAERDFKTCQELRRAMTENDLEALKKLIAKDPGIEIDQIFSDSGETLLTNAIKKDFREMRDFLIERGASLEKPNFNNETPLIAAVISRRDNSVRVLLDLRVGMEKKNADGDTALHIALKKNMDEISILLIKQGASIEALDANERSAVRLAQENQVPHALELIESILKIEVGAPDITSFRNLLQQGDNKRLKSVLRQFPRIAADHLYEAINPLALLVDLKDETTAIQSAEILIDHQANVNGPIDAEQTPLIRATIQKKKTFANLFLQSNANPQLQDKDGKSALIHAVEKNDLELVELLLGYSANEKYTFRRDGKKYSFSACETARKVEKTLKTSEEKAANHQIKKRLDCGFLRWVF